MLKYLVAFFVSMVPIIELRGGVPIAMEWGVDWYVAIIICAVGNMIPVPFIYFFARKFLNWGADKRLIGKLCFGEVNERLIHRINAACTIYTEKLLHSFSDCCNTN